MIVRILGEGQFDVPDADVKAVNELDDRLSEAVDAGDVDAFTRCLGDLLAAVRVHANPHAPDALDTSDVVLPGDDASLEDVRRMLSDDGLIPG